MEKNLEEITGEVKEICLGGKSAARYFVKGDKVIIPNVGGKPLIIGYVKDGVAYMPRVGGKPEQIGKVKYYKK